MTLEEARDRLVMPLLKAHFIGKNVTELQQKINKLEILCKTFGENSESLMLSSEELQAKSEILQIIKDFLNLLMTMVAYAASQQIDVYEEITYLITSACWFSSNACLMGVTPALCSWFEKAIRLGAGRSRVDQGVMLGLLKVYFQIDAKPSKKPLFDIGRRKFGSFHHFQRLHDHKVEANKFYISQSHVLDGIMKCLSSVSEGTLSEILDNLFNEILPRELAAASVTHFDLFVYSWRRLFMSWSLIFAVLSWAQADPKRNCAYVENKVAELLSMSLSSSVKLALCPPHSDCDPPVHSYSSNEAPLLAFKIFFRVDFGNMQDVTIAGNCSVSECIVAMLNNWLRYHSFLREISHNAVRHDKEDQMIFAFLRRCVTAPTALLPFTRSIAPAIALKNTNRAFVAGWVQYMMAKMNRGDESIDGFLQNDALVEFDWSGSVQLIHALSLFAQLDTYRDITSTLLNAVDQVKNSTQRGQSLDREAVFDAIRLEQLVASVFSHIKLPKETLLMGLQSLGHAASAVYQMISDASRGTIALSDSDCLLLLVLGYYSFNCYVYTLVHAMTRCRDILVYTKHTSEADVLSVESTVKITTELFDPSPTNEYSVRYGPMRSILPKLAWTFVVNLLPEISGVNGGCYERWQVTGGARYDMEVQLCKKPLSFLPRIMTESKSMGDVVSCLLPRLMMYKWPDAVLEVYSTTNVHVQWDIITVTDMKNIITQRLDHVRFLQQRETGVSSTHRCLDAQRKCFSVKEICLEIFEFLPSKQIRGLRRVSKGFRALACEPHLWRSVYMRTWRPVGGAVFDEEYDPSPDVKKKNSGKTHRRQQREADRSSKSSSMSVVTCAECNHQSMILADASKARARPCQNSALVHDWYRLFAVINSYFKIA